MKEKCSHCGGSGYEPEWFIKIRDAEIAHMREVDKLLRENRESPFTQ